MQLEVYALSEHLCTVKCAWETEVSSLPAACFLLVGTTELENIDKVELKLYDR